MIVAIVHGRRSQEAVRAAVRRRVLPDDGAWIVDSQGEREAAVREIDRLEPSPGEHKTVLRQVNVIEDSY